MAMWLRYLAFAPLHAAAISFLVDYAHPKRWLIASSPSDGGIYYATLPRGNYLDSGTQLSVLIPANSSGLDEPMGLAVDLRRQRLFVADPGASKILAFPLVFSRNESYLAVGAPITCAEGTSARWVAVDDEGSIFFTDESANQIQTIPVTQLAAGNTTPKVLYDGETILALSAPGGIAVDSFWIYYVNKESGTQRGSVVRAPKAGVTDDWAAANPDLLQQVVEPLVTNTDKSYGICVAMGNIFYTQPDNYVYGILSGTQGGGTYATINDRMTNPRGCVFDNDGTVYVADRGAGAIYSFAGNQQVLQPALVQFSATLEDAFAVAMFSDATRLAFFSPMGILLALVGFVAATAAAQPA